MVMAKQFYTELNSVHFIIADLVEWSCLQLNLSRVMPWWLRTKFGPLFGNKTSPSYMHIVILTFFIFCILHQHFVAKDSWIIEFSERKIFVKNSRWISKFLHLLLLFTQWKQWFSPLDNWLDLALHAFFILKNILWINS